MKKSDIGIIGLGVMGKNLALNIENKGYTVSVYNRKNKERKEQRSEEFIRLFGEHRKFSGFDDLEKFIESLEKPRKVFVMVRTGIAVDSIIEHLIPLLSQGDVIIDGGNSDFKDTERRKEYLDLKGILFVGAGIIGGEESSTKGFCIMPGGAPQAWSIVRPVLQSIAVRASDGLPCCEWVGNGGAGHFVKMVVNGMECANLQLISEAYSVIQKMLKANNETIAYRFEEWNKGKLNGYLVEITSKILKHTNEKGESLIDNIQPKGSLKGIEWQIVASAMELGIPTTVLATAIFSRDLLVEKQLRMEIAEQYATDKPEFIHHQEVIIQEIYDALHSAQIIAFTQAFELIKKASQQYNWQLNLANIARIWRAGSMISGNLLNHIVDAFEADKGIKNLLFSPYFEEQIRESLPGWKAMVIKATRENISFPTISAALNYFFTLTSKQLPLNLIQAQQDYFKGKNFKSSENSQYKIFEEEGITVKTETQEGVYNMLAKTIKSSIIN